jgi:hypothetical protein
LSGTCNLEKRLFHRLFHSYLWKTFNLVLFSPDLSLLFIYRKKQLVSNMPVYFNIPAKKTPGCREKKSLKMNSLDALGVHGGLFLRGT